MVCRKTAFFKILLSFALATASLTPASAASWETIENCDMGSPSLKDLKAPNREECQAKCEANTDCQGVIYVTGWKKCQLKANVKKHAKLRFQSGDLDAKHEYLEGSFKNDHDHTGKDLERLVLGDADACGKACAAKEGCGSFTYLDGYRVCWLKKPGGHVTEKVFSCSIKKS